MYDYIVVGAGSAGCVLASRLSEEPHRTVLLLECGGRDVRRTIHIPAAFTRLFNGPCDWAFYTDPQRHVDNRKMFWPRGKVLGGSSSINAMIYIRGNHRDYDEWSSLGNEGWGFRDVLPFFKRAEHQERGPSEYHGTGGPLNVADRRYTNRLTHAFVEAGVEAGLPWNDDFNGAEQDGVGLYQVTQKRGRRHSTAAAYLKPVSGRPNLTVRTDAQVTRLLLEGSRVTGVELLQNGVTERVSASAEVILSAGAVNSPHLLMLSGIGPADHLRSAGVSVAHDLPGVGENLQDHLVLPVAFESTQPVSIAGSRTLKNIVAFTLLRRGPLTSNLAEAGGFTRTKPDLPMPDLQLHFVPAYFLDHGLNVPDGHAFTIGPTLIHPKSVGTIKLRSSDPLQPPAIDPNYLAERDDLDVLTGGVKLARRLADAKAFEQFRGVERFPGPSVESDDEIAAYVRRMVQTLYHPVGTCKMGRDPMAVVDDRLRVHGVEGLRVADASIMPTIVGGNTNAPVIMIGEKAADLIRSGA